MDINSLALSLQRCRKEKSMIKVEKKVGTINAELKGSTYVLLAEFRVALRMLYQVLDGSIKETESVTPRDLMRSMVEDVVNEERRNKDED